ncbi:MAG: hypothetical protein ACOX4W_05240 [Bacilli bacterium]
MSNFWKLVKVNFINDFRLNNLFKGIKRKSKLKISLIIFFSILIYFLMMGIITAYFYIFGEIFQAENAIYLILLLGLSIASFLSLIATVFKVNGYLFGARDFDLLMSMPIKPKTIIGSKLFGLYLMNLIFFSIIYIPTIALYFYFGGFDVVSLIISVFIFFIAPLFPIAVSGFIGYILGFFIYRFKYKNLLTIIGSLAFIVVVMALSFAMPDASNAEMVTFFESKFKNIYYLAVFAVEGIEHNFLSLLIFTAISIIPSLLFVLLVGKNFVGANERTKRVYRNKNYVYVAKTPNSVRVSLVKKEFKRYFTIPIYFLNTIVGPIMSTVMSVIFLVSGGEVIAATGIDNSMFYLILIAIAIFTYGMISTTASSISLEGKQFWIMRSLPIKTEDVFFSKMAVNIGICLPFIIINPILASIFLGFNLIGFVFLLIIPMLLIVCISAFGLFVNLLLPRFDWDTPTKVVKQSASVLVVMLGGFLLTAIFIVLGYLLIDNKIPLVYVYLIGSLFAIVLTALVLIVLLTKGKKIYERLPA